MRPAAGIVGVLVHPFQGAWKGMQSPIGRRQEQQERITRISDGIEAVRNSTESQRSGIIRKFNSAKPGTKERQRKYKDLAEKVMLEGAETDRKDSDRSKDGGASPSSSKSSPTSPSKSPPPPLTPRRLPPPFPRSGSQRSGRGEPDEDAEFERDLELAKQLSLAEQRGYERGLAGQFHK